MSPTLVLKSSLAAVAATALFAVYAQGTPPSPTVANPAQGAGQQSSQATPMGTTGAQPATTAAPDAAATTTTTTTESTTSSAPATTPTRTARADRN